MALELFDISKEVVGLTGGGGYLGREMALGLCAAGANVFICGREEQKLKSVAEDARQRGMQGRIFFQALDLTKEDHLDRFLDFVLEKGGKLSGWINNAASGISQLQGEMTIQGVNATLEQCLSQVLVATQAAALKMTLTGGGSIVNIASIYGMVSPQPKLYEDFPGYHNPPAYGAAKGGIIQYTRYAACHLAKDNIRVNSLSPGPFPDEETQKETRFIQELEKRVPLQGIGKPMDLLGPLIFLLSPASSYMTGQNLAVDGGWTVW